MIKNVRHFGVVVTNMQKSLQFYRDLLGLDIQRELHESGKFLDNMLNMKNVNVHTVKMSVSDGTTLVELLEFESHPKSLQNNVEVSNIGASHLAFTVYDLHDTYTKLKNTGIKFNAPPQNSPDGYAKVTFCYDPDGTPIELVEILDPTVTNKINSYSKNE